MSRPFDPERMCGATTNARFNGGAPCRQPKGYRTDHAGIGECWLHGGRTPNGRKAAAREAVERTIARLGVPRGNGDPIALLADAVRHSQGLLEATAAIVADHSGEDGANAIKRTRLDLEAALEAYENAIRQAATTGSLTVNAKVAEQLAAVEQRKIELLQLALQRALDRMAPEPAWRDRFLAVVGEELVAITAPPSAAVAGRN